MKVLAASALLAAGISTIDSPPKRSQTMLTFLPSAILYMFKSPAAIWSFYVFCNGSNAEASLSVVNLVRLLELLRVEENEAQKLRSIEAMEMYTPGIFRQILRWIEIAVFPPLAYVQTLLGTPGGFVHSRNLSYSKAHPSCLLDVITCPSSLCRVDFEEPRIIIYAHGGGWTIGNRQIQSVPLQLSLAKKGWIVCTIDYRLAPKFPILQQIKDVKTAVHFVRTALDLTRIHPKFAAERRPRRRCVCMAGESAGGHLTALACVTMNDEFFHEEEGMDTRIDAGVDLYGVHDLTDAENHFSAVDEAGDFFRFVEYVVKKKKGHELFERLSPTLLLDSRNDERRGTPPCPMFGVHGTHDTLVPVRDSERFYASLSDLRKRYGQSVDQDTFVEVRQAPHAFNLVSCPSSFALNDAVASFLERRLPRGDSASYL